jgi:flagellar biosynthetic protein FliR
MTAVLMLVRVTCFLTAIPLFGAKSLPAIVKIGLALSLTFMWSLSAHIPSNVDTLISSNWIGFGIMVVSELIIGVTLGMAFGVFHLPARIAGAYVAQEMGVNMSTGADANQGQNATIMASLFEAIAILMFFGLNVHYLLFVVLNISFERLPVGTPLTHVPDLAVIDSFARIDELGVSLVAPIVVLLFLGVVFLLLINKASPSMNLFSLGLSLRIIAGLFAVFLFLPQICQAIEYSFDHGQNLIMNLLNSMFE